MESPPPGTCLKVLSLGAIPYVAIDNEDDEYSVSVFSSIVIVLVWVLVLGGGEGVGSRPRGNPNPKMLQSLTHSIRIRYSRVYAYRTSSAWNQPSAQHVVNSSFAFGNFLGFFLPNIFHLRLVASVDTKPMYMKG